ERKAYNNKTFKPIIYSAYTISNGLALYDDIDDIEDDYSIIDALKKIAYINILKLPGNTSTPHSKLQEGYSIHREILLKQIQTFNPDVIIGGNTIPILRADLELDKSDFADESNYEHDFWLKDGKLYIHCKHPSATLGSSDK